ncbi:MAG: hypothetical protein A2W91_04925 [Bacteroidetes bacterium GWF2_38_335]|nr:MAG: hypothetical protein A2W91_04925 [Bacteroidetes bacterium GWF2_38_335]OFY79826.1 MAG: hypothetical protein A2281_10495 [Bacteroidetes bacterium RIFOXYA12_FULL_38_20]
MITIQAQPTFSEPNVIIESGTTDGARSVYSADIDGDSDLDVITASYNDDKIAWYENIDGQGTFGVQKIITLSATGANSVCSVDIDGDGDFDVLSSSSMDNKITWYENTDGFGTFSTTHVICNTVNNPQSVFFADIDGDSDMDVLSASAGDDKIAWYENTDGAGTFGPQIIISTNANGATSVYSADIDLDGDMDVLSASVADNKIAWYENTNGTGTFGIQRVITTSAYTAYSVCCADIDGDGDLDVLSASATTYDNRVAWYENTDGAGSFGPQQIISVIAYGSNSVYYADIDNDDDIDVLSSSFWDKKIAWYENTDGAGTFGVQQIISENADGAYSVFCADIDNDGDIDVFSASSSDDKIAWYENTDSAGTFGPELMISAFVNGVNTVCSADIDGDGDMDVLSASHYDDKIAWYENLDGLGTFGPQKIISILVENAQDVCCADIDNDGDLDVLSASYDDDMIAWYENTDGAGTFGPQQTITNLVNGAQSVYFADVDDDGDMDVLAAGYLSGKISWFENTDGTGVFGPQQVISSSVSGAYSVYCSDIDGDGDIDVLSASYWDDEIAWYENTDGTGTFGPQQVITSLAERAVDVYSADVDGDGDMDVLSASSYDSKIAWYQNTDGAGTFGSQNIISTNAVVAQSVLADDLDCDGDMDVISASMEDNKIAWYENTDGSGLFGSQNIISNDANGARSVYSADIDGDGDMDVLSASWTDNKIAWYENILETGIETIDHKDLFIYPNPTNGIFTLYYPFTISEFKIINITGNVVLSSSDKLISKPTFQIDLSGYESGIYFILIQTDNQIVTEKIIKE